MDVQLGGQEIDGMRSTVHRTVPQMGINQGQETKGGAVAGAVKAPGSHTRHVVKMTRRDGLERLGTEYGTGTVFEPIGGEGHCARVGF